MPSLERYKDELCCSNDDTQDTTAAAVGILLAAYRAKGERLSEQIMTFVGAGSAGCGTVEQIIAAMQLGGLDEAQARRRIFIVGHWGLFIDDMNNLLGFRHRLAQKRVDLGAWGGQQGDDLALLEVVCNARPTVPIGIFGQRGPFSEEVTRRLYGRYKQPLAMPLFNLTSWVEAAPQEILNWTDGQALVAADNPFQPMQAGNKRISIAQCNNTSIFPGIGLGVIAARANRVTEGTLMAVANVPANCSPIAAQDEGAVLPASGDVRKVSKRIIVVAAKQAQAEGKALYASGEVLSGAIGVSFQPSRYRAHRRTSF